MSACPPTPMVGIRAAMSYRQETCLLLCLRNAGTFIATSSYPKWEARALSRSDTVSRRVTKSFFPVHSAVSVKMSSVLVEVVLGTLVLLQVQAWVLCMVGC